MSTATLDEQHAKALQIVRKITAVATLPEITGKIISTVEDPRSTAAQLHKIVSHDPALATRLLKVVNSAFYGLPGQIASVERAIVLLGLNAVKNIAVAASLGQLFKSGPIIPGVTVRDLWVHCIATGVAARDIARQLRLAFVEEAFLAGMIHDLGVLISLQEFSDKFRTVCERAMVEDLEFCAIEREVIGVDHQSLGMALVEEWRFPRLCHLVTGYHHRPLVLAEDVRLLPQIIYIADALCSECGVGVGLTSRQSQIPTMLAPASPVTAQMVQSTRERLAEMVAVAVDVFSGTTPASAGAKPVRKAS